MSHAKGMCDIILQHAEEKLQYFLRVEPTTKDVNFLYLQGDWQETREEAIKASAEAYFSQDYADEMVDDEITQVIKVADDQVLFTGLIGDEVVVVSFKRGILSVLPPIVSDFREYMLENDVDFTALNPPS